MKYLIIIGLVILAVYAANYDIFRLRELIELSAQQETDKSAETDLKRAEYLAATAEYELVRAGQLPIPEVVTEQNKEAPKAKEILKMESFVCGQNSTYYSAKIVVTNVSNSVINYPRAFVKFIPKGATPFVDDALISPLKLPPGAMGEVTIISNDADGRGYSCELMRMQDTDGVRIF